MQSQRKTNWSSLIGWLIFILVIAGGPIQGVIQSIFGITLPGYVLPALIGGLILLSILASVFGQIGASIRNTGETTAAPSPMEEFDRPIRRGEMAAPRLPRTSLSTSELQRAYDRNPTVKPPAFEPIINPRVVAVGVVGLIILAALGLMVVVVGP